MSEPLIPEKYLQQLSLAKLKELAGYFQLVVPKGMKKKDIIKLILDQWKDEPVQSDEDIEAYIERHKDEGKSVRILRIEALNRRRDG